MQVNFPIAQHFHFQNLLRWYDLIHHTADKQKLFPAAPFKQAKFQPPPPPVPQPKVGASVPQLSLGPPSQLVDQLHLR